MLDQWERDALMNKLADLEVLSKADPNACVRNSDIEILIAICKRLLEIIPVK